MARRRKSSPGAVDSPWSTTGAAHMPGHPDADAEGFVRMPNVQLPIEMVNLMTASRAYEANVTCIESIKAMARSALKIGQ